MPKPNKNSSLTEMKDYIRMNKLNHPAVKLGMKKADMIAGLKKIGHWDDATTAKKKTRKKREKVASDKEVPKNVTTSEFNAAREGLRKVVKKPFVLQGLQVSQPYRELAIQGMRTQAAMNQSDKNIAELSSYF